MVPPQAQPAAQPPEEPPEPPAEEPPAEEPAAGPAAPPGEEPASPSQEASPSEQPSEDSRALRLKQLRRELDGPFGAEARLHGAPKHLSTYLRVRQTRFQHVENEFTVLKTISSC